MKRVLVTILVMLVMLSLVSAASHYVRRGATGNGSGTDWNNAYTSLPAALTRGDTYYIAAGTYNGYVFNDPGSRGTFIYIKKATAANSGQVAGWQASYGDQVVIGDLDFTTAYYEIDGVVGGGPGSWDSGHGIKIRSADMLTVTNSLIFLEGGVRDIVFKHCEMTYDKAVPYHNSYFPTGARSDIVMGSRGGNNLTFSYCWIHDSPRTLFYTTNWTGITIEYSMLDRNGVVQKYTDGTTIHSEIWAARNTNNVIVRHCRILNWVSTGGLMSMSPCSDWDIYGNVFQRTITPGSSSSANGVIGNLTKSSATNYKIYNNSFVSIKGITGVLTTGGKTNCVCYNNMWYNTSASIGAAHDYNWFYNSNEAKITEAHMQVGTGDPFVNWQAGDFRLKAATQGGLTLSHHTTWILTDGSGGRMGRGTGERWNMIRAKRRISNSER